MHPTVEAMIERYRLLRLPVEGTLFVSTYRSSSQTADGGPAGTAMIGMYAHEPASRSLFHRLPNDEVWHFYSGDPFRLVLLHPDGSSEDRWMGAGDGLEVQTIVPAGVWQAGELHPDGMYALFGCTMAPGFTGAGFEGGGRSELGAAYPSRLHDIVRLGVPDDEVVHMPAGFAT